MKILFFLSIELNKQATSGHLIVAMIKALCQEGHSVHIIQKKITSETISLKKELPQYNITTECIPFTVADKGNFVLRYLKELKYVYKASKKIGTGFDAVFIQSTTVAGYTVKKVRKKLPKATITFNVQDIFPYNLACTGSINKKKIFFKLLAAFQRYGYNHSDHIVTISEDMKDLLIEDGVDKSKIEIVYNWSYQDEPYKNIDYSPIEHMFKKRYFNVVYAGNIGVMQNVDIIIRTARYMKKNLDVWFHIIGNGIYKDNLMLLAKKYRITNVSFWPMQTPENAPAIYSMADLNIIPLVKNAYKTALPSKIATCMACGKPIVFAIGKDSKFGQRIADETDCIVTESDNIRDLGNSIIYFKTNRFNSDSEIDFFRKNMSITNNSRRYAQIIVR